MRRSKPKRGVVAFARRWYRRVMWLRLAAMVVGAAYGVATVLRRKPLERELPSGFSRRAVVAGGRRRVAARRGRSRRDRRPAGSPATSRERQAPVVEAVLARTATAVVGRRAPRLGRAAPTGSCPDGYPIKANATSMIYHQPGGALLRAHPFGPLLRRRRQRRGGRVPRGQDLSRRWAASTPSSPRPGRRRDRCCASASTPTRRSCPSRSTRWCRSTRRRRSSGSASPSSTPPPTSCARSSRRSPTSPPSAPRRRWNGCAPTSASVTRTCR